MEVLYNVKKSTDWIKSTYNMFKKMNMVLPDS